MKSASLISSSMYRGMIGILATTALLFSANLTTANAGYPSNVDPDLLRAAEQLEADSRDLSYEIQSGNYSSSYFGAQQLLMSVKQMQNASSQYTQGLRYYGSGGSYYSILLSSYVKLKNDIKIISQYPNVSYKMDMVEQSVAEVRFYVECGQPTNPNGGSYAAQQVQQIILMMRSSISRTKMLAGYEGVYGNFWRETSIKDLDELDLQLMSLTQEVMSSGTSMVYRDVQFVFSRSKRSLTRGGFSMAVLNSHRSTETALDQLKMTVAKLPMAGQIPGYNQGSGYGYGSGLEPVSCNTYRRKR